ncbi:hypothetical protein Taro_027904, partial [Colocasia esculenta]|nr:hypothetical protein [Colocasia esculenta]
SAYSTLEFSVCECDRGGRCVLNATALPVAFWKPPGIGDCLHVRRVSHAGRLADVNLRKATPSVEACSLACSRHGELAWSERNAVESLCCVFFVEHRVVIRGEDPGLGFLPVKATEPPVVI